jgi:hypothetical protein
MRKTTTFIGNEPRCPHPKLVVLADWLWQLRETLNKVSLSTGI